MADEHDNDDNRLENIRSRVHRLSDMVQHHEGTLIQHSTVIPILQKQLESAATREGLTNAFDTLKTQMESTAALYTEKLRVIENKLDPIQRGIYFVVILIVTAVIGAVLTLVVQGAP